jgi:hypothetical protein
MPNRGGETCAKCAVCARWPDRIADIIFEGEDLEDYGGDA